MLFKNIYGNLYKKINTVLKNLRKLLKIFIELTNIFKSSFVLLFKFKLNINKHLLKKIYAKNLN